MENYNDEDLVLREPIAVYGKKVFTIEEYLEFENASPEKHEYYNGEIFAMAGASDSHCDIEVNLLSALKTALKKSLCKPRGSSKSIHIPSNTLFTYPDITVTCKDARPDSERGASVPKVIIEVLSKSTRKYDRGKKFELYKDIPSFQEYILVDSQKIAVDIYRKSAQNTWELQQYRIKDHSIEIKALNIRISLNKIYEDVQFNENISIPIYNDGLGLREPIVAYGKKVFTIEEYLEFENASPAKHEYYKGEIFAMSGASDNHCYIERNLIVSLVIGLKKSPCEPLGSNKRLHIPSNTLFTYPDISVFCEEGFPISETDASLPRVLIEVLSKSTRKYDRGEKFELYKDIPTLQEYILVDSQKPAVDIYRKTVGNTWDLQEYAIKDGSIEIKALDLKISFEDIYKNIQLTDQIGFPNLNAVKGNGERA